MSHSLTLLPEEILLKICKAYFDYGWSATVEMQETFAGKRDSDLHTTKFEALLKVNKQLHRIAKEALRKTYDGTLTLMNVFQAMRDMPERWRKCKKVSNEVVRQQTTMIVAQVIGGGAVGWEVPKHIAAETAALSKHFEQLRRVTLGHHPLTYVFPARPPPAIAITLSPDYSLVSRTLRISPYRRFLPLVHSRQGFELEIIFSYLWKESRIAGERYFGYQKVKVTEVEPRSPDTSGYVLQSYTAGEFHEVSSEDELWYHVKHGTLEDYVAPTEEDDPAW